MSVPENCPECDRVLYPNFTHRPSPRWQPRARLLFLIGGLIAGPILLAAPFLAMQMMLETAPDRAANKGDRGSIGLILWVGLVVVAFVPAVVLGAWAYRMPRVIPMR